MSEDGSGTDVGRDVGQSSFDFVKAEFERYFIRTEVVIQHFIVKEKIT
jgi:hypothetical protein